MISEHFTRQLGMILLSSQQQETTIKKNRRLRLSEMFFQLRKFFGILVIGMMAMATNCYASVLEDVNFASLPGGRTEITLVFDSSPPEVKGYTIEEPARIALDLSGATSALTEKYYNLGLGNAKRMTVMGVKDRTRVIVDLVDLVPYRTRKNGNSLVIVVGDEGGHETVEVASTAINEVSNATNSSSSTVITGIDFQRSEKGDGQIVIDFSSSSVDIDMTDPSGSNSLV